MNESMSFLFLFIQIHDSIRGCDLALCGEFAYQIVPHDVGIPLKRKISNPSLPMLATADLGTDGKVSPDNMA